MQEKDIREILFSGFRSDMCYMIENGIRENRWSYELELFVLVLKSLTPSQSIGANAVDYCRFKSELQLWENYRHGGDKSVMRTLRGDRDSYWEESDQSILTRLIPIILANENKSASKREILKHTLYFSGCPRGILEGVIYNSLLSSLFEKNKSDGEILEIIKRDTIELSIMEDIVNKGYFQGDIEEYSGDYIVDFERKRLDLIIELGKVESIEGVLHLIDKRAGGYKYREFLYPLIRNEYVDYNSEFLDGLSAYIYKLRKGRVEPRRFKKIEKSIDIFDMRKGEIGDHPLLNRIRLISVGKRDGFEIRLVETRSGVYRFFRKQNSRK